MILTITLIIGLYVLLLAVLNIKKKKSKGDKKAKKVAFFHPFCNDGGGGEKVLWTMIEAILKDENKNPQQEIEVAIYTFQTGLTQKLQKTKKRFNIDLTKYEEKIKLVIVSGEQLLLPKAKLTMVCHIFLPMIYCLKCLFLYQPDIFYDTTGFAFNFVLVRFLLPTTQCHAYVHYPFISYDMIRKIQERRSDYNNDENISKSPLKSTLKLIYYRIILYLYKFVGFVVTKNKIQANSSWTYGHMTQLWGNGVGIKKLYPPCSISSFLEYKKEYKGVYGSKNKIMSLAQFRPQKNQTLQIEVIKKLVDTMKQNSNDNDIPTLSICGTTRGQGDEKILQNLKSKVKELNMSEYVSFHVNLPFEQILNMLKQSTIGIHTMQAEHFGISIVEMLASGCIVVAHNSAGPKEDIIKNSQYLAQSQEEYYEKLFAILQLKPEEQKTISEGFREKMKEFGESEFKRSFLEILKS